MTTWFGKHRIDVEACGSTNDEAARFARAGASHGTIVVAEQQTAGRGRDGRSWRSPRGNLYLSAVVRPPIGLEMVPPMTLAIGIGVCDAIRASGVMGVLKWPNDVLVDMKKIAGVLVEAQSQGSRLESVIVGIGLNIAAVPDEVSAIATSLEDHGAPASPGFAGTRSRAERGEVSTASPGFAGTRSGAERGEVSTASPGFAGTRSREEHGEVSTASPGFAGTRSRAERGEVSIDRELVIARVCTQVERWIDRYVAIGLPSIIDAWQSRMAIGLTARAGQLIGELVGLDVDGALLLRTSDGEIHRVRSGDVDVIRPPLSGNDTPFDPADPATAVPAC